MDNKRVAGAGSVSLIAVPRSILIIGLPTAFVPHSASSAENDLWAKALKELPASDQAALREALGDPTTRTTTTTATMTSLHVSPQTLPHWLDHLCAVAKRKQTEFDAKRWCFELHGRKYIMRDVVHRVIVWLNLFKQVGDVAVQYDPGHAALPWAGVRFLLKVSKHEEMDETVSPSCW
jgi:hypothetical protein